MANSTSGNPWALDTTGAITAQETTIDFVRWVSTGAAAADRCLLKDSAGTTIFDTYATGANYVEQAPIRKRFAGVTLTTLTTGVLYVYLDTKPKGL